MRHPHRSAAVLAVAAFSALSLTAHRVPAQGGVAGPADAPVPAAVGSLAVAPADDWLTLIGDMAGKETADRIRGAIDQFQRAAAPLKIEPRMDVPIGMSFYAGEGMTAQNSAVLAAPLKDGSVTPDQLVAAGLRPAAGSADVFSPPGGQQIYVKRTDNYVLFGASDKAIKSATESEVVGAYTKPVGPFDVAKPGTLVVGTFDMVAFGRAAPVEYAGLLAKIRADGEQDQSGTDFDRAGRRAGTMMVYSAIEGLDKTAYAVTADADGVKVSVAFAPGDLDAPKPRPRPAFPDGCVGRLDLTYASAAQASWAVRGLDWMAEQTKDAVAKDKEAADGFRVCRAALSDLTTGTSLSFAVRPTKDDKAVGYAIEGFDHEADVPAALDRLAADVRKLAKTPADAGKVKTSTYDDAGRHVTRLELDEDDGKGKVFVDAVQDGPMAYMTFAADDGHHLDELTAAKPDGGTLTKVCEGSADLSLDLEKAFDAPFGPLQQLDDDAKKRLLDAFRGRRVTFDLTSVDHYAVMTATVPRPVVKAIVEAAMASR